MTLTQDRILAEFQRQLSDAAPHSTLILEAPLERPGPIVIPNEMTLDGCGCTIWSQSGPVIWVRSPNVTLKNLRIEYTADAFDEGVALKTDHHDLILMNVTVRGAVVGLNAEAGEWRYPRQLDLGTLTPRQSHTLIVRMVVPVPCHLSSNVSGLRLEPSKLSNGMHEVRFHLDEMMNETMVYGTLAIQTAFLRREITINGRVVAPIPGQAPATTTPGQVIWTPADWNELKISGVGVPVAKPVVGPITSPVVDLTPEPKVSPVISTQPPATPTRKSGTQTITGPIIGPAFSPRAQPTPDSSISGTASSPSIPLTTSTALQEQGKPSSSVDVEELEKTQSSVPVKKAKTIFDQPSPLPTQEAAAEPPQEEAPPAKKPKSTFGSGASIPIWALPKSPNPDNPPT